MCLRGLAAAAAKAPYYSSLNILRRLAKLLGGDLHVGDRIDGVRGGRFSLRIPLTVPPAHPSGTPDLGAIHGTSPEHDMQLAKEGRDAILVKRNVLVVDDSEGNRRLLRRMLLQLGCRVVEAADGDEVLGVLASAATATDGALIDIVLMDVEMSRMDGVSAVREMRKAGWPTPAVAVTGNAGAEAAVDCMRG